MATRRADTQANSDPSGAAAPTLPLGRILVGDCIEQMRTLPDDSVDLIFADPPYNIGFAYDGHYEDRQSDDDYERWTHRWIDAAANLLKPSGSLYILIGDEYAAETRLHLKTLQKNGRLLFRNWIVWHYTFGQRCKIKFNRSHAHLFYCVGSAAVTQTGSARSNLAKKPPFTFNYDAVAVPSARMTTYGDVRQNPRGKLPDDTWVNRFPAMGDWHVRPQDAADEGWFNTEADTWQQSRLAGTFREREQWHPCQLPEALLERILLCSSNENDVVFDPFAGSGTTLAVARRLQRQWSGCELSPQYAAKAMERIQTVTPGADDATPARRAPVVTANGKRPGRRPRTPQADAAQSQTDPDPPGS